MDLRGEQLLMDFYDRPELVDRLLSILAETVIRFQSFWLEKRGGEPWEDIVLGGCATTMLSARMLERFLSASRGSAGRCCPRVHFSFLENVA